MHARPRAQPPARHTNKPGATSVAFASMGTASCAMRTRSDAQQQWS